jgi:hypothetical protein
MSLSMDPRPSSPVGALHIDVEPAQFEAKADEPSFFMVQVANGDSVIREVALSVLGMDTDWVEFTPKELTLFPEERGTVVVAVTLPNGFPSGEHQIAIEVTDTSAPDSPVVAYATVEVAADHRIATKIEPPSIDTTSRGQFTGTITNRGNSTVDVTFALVDPEGLTESVFDPPMVHLIPGDEAVVRIDVKGKRPWFGASALRFLTIEANAFPSDIDADTNADPVAVDSVLVRVDPPIVPMGNPTSESVTANALPVGATAEPTPSSDNAPDQPTSAATAPPREPVATDLSLLTISHAARIPRKRLTLLGLLLAATTFAAVFSLSFGKVAEQTKASEELLKKSLSGGKEKASGTVSPAGIGGKVISATGTGIDGATVELYEKARGGLLSLRTTVTDQSGLFRFGGLPPAIYKVKVTAAGYGERWYPQANAFDDAQELELKEGAAVPDLTMQIAGQPAVISGVVLGNVVDGAKVTIQLPAGAVPDSDGVTEVASVTVGADGVFELINLPAPGTYEVAATAPGLSTQTRTIAVQPGQHVDKVSLLLQPGLGVVSGRVIDGRGTPVSGAAITLIAGTARRGTVTLSGDVSTAGRFEIRELTVPSTLSLSVSAPGYLTASETVVLDKQNQRADRSITLLPAGASLGGLVRSADGHALGGVTVTISGGSFKRVTQTLSQGEVGHWLVTDVPTPGDYTVTFTADRIVPVTQAVGLPSGSAGRLDIDVTVSAAVASVAGLVRELGSAPDPATCNPTDTVFTDCPSRLGAVSVVLSATGVERKTLTAHMPTGAFQMGDLAPGPYTITFSRVGSTPQTLFVELIAAQNLTVPDIFLEPQARVTGQVTHIGLPTANVSVRVYLASKYPQVAEATTITDAAGRYTIVGLVAPETYIVEFQYPVGGQIVASKEVFLHPGAVADGNQAI